MARRAEGAGAAALALAALCLAVGAATVQRPPGKDPGKQTASIPRGRAAALEDLGGLDCVACHAQEATEWARTAHALAWVNEPYREALAERARPEVCWACHVPRPVHATGVGERPKPRADHRGLGVGCRSCHEAEDGAMLGPTGTATEFHATRRSDTMRAPGSNELCAGCHATTIGPVVGIAQDFRDADRAAQGLSCVGCHLEPEAPDASGRAGLSHVLRTPWDPTFLRLAFSVYLRRADGRTWVEVRGRAGHGVPGFVGRELRLEARAIGGEARAVRVLTTDDPLEVGGTFALELGDWAGPVEVLGWHADPRLAGPVRFLEERLE